MMNYKFLFVGGLGICAAAGVVAPMPRLWAQDAATADYLTPDSKVSAAGNGVDEWLKTHKAEEFTGQVWARVRVDEPKDYRYAVIVDSETNPYTPARFASGTITAQGLQPSGYEDGNHWGKELPWVAPATENDWLKTGASSPWVKLPVSPSAFFHTAFIVRPQDTAASMQIKLHIEFASGADAKDIFHVSDEPTNETGTAIAMMPTSGGEEGLRKLETFTEAAKRRLAFVQSLKLGPPPHLEKLRVNTWALFGIYRASAGSAALETVAPDFQVFESLGINMASVMGVDDALFEKMAKKHHLIDTTITAWAGAWNYSSEADAGQYKWQEGETPKQHWQRVANDYYSKYAVHVRKREPFAFSISTHLNLGDEPNAATSAQEIRETPHILQDFRQWLQAQGLQPSQLIGDTDTQANVAKWDDVLPTDDRKPMADKPDDARYARRFYYTRRYINHYTVLYYDATTQAVKKAFGDRKLIAVNYQAGPMQYGFIGNNNDTDKAILDFFDIGREGAMQGVMMEDWTYGWDLGIGRIRMGSQMMRAAARARNLPMASYLVGGEAIRAELFAYLMSGIKENGLYLYGPVGNIGPAWADMETSLKETADVTRQLKKFENEIDQAQVRPTKAAMLIATTSDIMQAHGLYFAPERQNFYVALEHNYLPVEIVSEQDITQGDLLENYSLLYVTDPQVSTAVQRKIADWVKNGGRLWAQVGAANWDEFNRDSSVLDEVFGVENRGTAWQEGGLQPSASSWSGGATKFDHKRLGTLKSNHPVFGEAVEVAVWGAKLIGEPTTAKVIGTYEDGKPAILENKFGKGEAMLVGAIMGETYTNAYYSSEPGKDWNALVNWKLGKGEPESRLVTGFASRAGVLRPVLLSTPGIYNAVMQTPDATLVLLNNASGKPLEKVTVRVREAGKVKRIASTRQDQIAFRSEKDEVVLEMPLENTDIICLYR